MTLPSLRSERGFSLSETIVATTFCLVVSAMAFATMNAALPSLRVDNQVSRVAGLLRTARETAIARQRDVELRFDVSANRVMIVRHEIEQEVPVEMVALESHVVFTQFEGMGDTPDGYGSNDAVDFGGAQPVFFAADGSVVDAAGIPANGTIFLGIEGRRETARAITITGSTARWRVYKWAPASQLWQSAWATR
jgi:hypothetical protein